ncbi:MerR family transcriptional regulator [Saccharothrix mutabilis subsp. mutabilis]|uniref:MerR family transcriptional regulator n=2 Tax=Saccharothrix mutabilis TaxID=33921 RepID=A0ABP3DH18_9PSEU
MGAMSGDTSLTIGDLARRSGLSVKAVRFYADRGMVPPTHRGPTGHRRFDHAAAARLDLVRTLRDLGVDLATIQRVLDRETTVAEVAAAHADALDAHLRVLVGRRAVLRRLATNPEEIDVVHDLALLSADARRELVAGFLAEVFAGRSGVEGIARTLTPELPDDPEPAQVAAWVELAALARDPGFRTLLARLTARYGRLGESGGDGSGRSGGSSGSGGDGCGWSGGGGSGWSGGGGSGGVRPDAVAVVRDRVRPLLALDPTAPEAGEVVAELTDRFGDGLAEHLEAVNDPRRERYLTLLALINGWAAPESTRAEVDWFLRASHHHTR